MRQRMLTSMLALFILAIPSVNSHPQDVVPQDADERRERRRTPVVEVFEANRDVVVNISATQLRAVRDRFGMFDDDLFDRWFDLPVGPRRRIRQTSVGSGFVLHRQGYIVTNAHVAARAEDTTVTLSDGTELPADVVAIDPEHDLAVLRVDAARSLKSVSLGRSDDLMVGETVIAIGNPYGYQHTVTAGVVSALDRTIEVTDRIRFTGLIQTDASINPGNSGGPLFNVLGELIGVNTAIRADAENIGFAIPVDRLRALLPSLLDIEHRHRVETGLSLVERDDAVVVESVASGTAAEAAGLRAGDVVVAVDGQPARTLVDYHIDMLGRQPGEWVDLKVDRDGAMVATSLELRPLPMPDGAALARARLGLVVEELNQDDLRKLGLQGRSAVRIVEVLRGGSAYAVDMREGDFLTAINGDAVVSLDQLGLLLEPLSSGDRIMITHARVGRNFSERRTVPMRVE